MKQIILASASPRRKELLEQLGLDFEIRPSRGEEIITKTKPEEVVKELAYQKAMEISKEIQSEYGTGKENYVEKPVQVIGADTIVVCDNQIFGKPVDEADAKRMLTHLQGNTHQVYTGVCVVTFFAGGSSQCIPSGYPVMHAHPGRFSQCTPSGYPVMHVHAGGFLQCTEFVEKTDVTMYPVSEQEILEYISTQECMDKAGAYAIQGISGRFIKEIHGDYNNVVGLPIARLWQECFKNGYSITE